MYYFVDQRGLDGSLYYLITSTYTLEHLMIYCECLWWQAKTLYSLCVLFVAITMAHHLYIFNKLASYVLAWLYSFSDDINHNRVSRGTACTVFVKLFALLTLINRVCFWCTGKLFHSSREDLRRLYQRIPLINHRPRGAHFIFLYRFRMWLERVLYLNALITDLDL